MKIVVDVSICEEALATLQQHAELQIELITPPAESSREVEVERIRDAEIYFCTFPPANHTVMTELKWIQIASTGYTQLLPLNLPARGVRATNARGCFDVPIAEWNIAMMINLARNCRQLIRNQDVARWDRSACFQTEIRGKTVGFWGYGGLARETARIARQLGLRIHTLTRDGVKSRNEAYTLPGTGDPQGVLPDRVFCNGQQQKFLAGLDFLVVALPLTPATEGIIKEDELRALPRSAFVLNPARGPIIKEKALIRALREKWIAGAALDTHYYYPMPPDHPLWQFENVFLTPHISGSTLNPNFRQRLWEIFLINLKRYTQGEQLLNELTPAQLTGK